MGKSKSGSVVKYQLVNRSIQTGEDSGVVANAGGELVEIKPSGSRGRGPRVRFYDTEEQDSTLFGFYNYEKHLKEIGGHSGPSVFIPARTQAAPDRNLKRSFAQDDDGADEEKLGRERVKVLRKMGVIIDDSAEARPDMDAEYLRALEGDDDVDFVDDFDDDFLVQLTGVPLDDIPLDAENLEMTEYVDEDGMDDSFYLNQDFEFKDDPKESMQMEDFEDEFEAALQEYTDEEIGELDDEDEDLQGTLDVNDLAEKYSEVLDGFLEERHRAQELSEYGGQMLPTDLNEDAQIIMDKTRAAFDRLAEQDVTVSDEQLRAEFCPEKIKSQWDCQSILSRNTVSSKMMPKTIDAKSIRSCFPKSLRIGKGASKLSIDEESSKISQQDREEDEEEEDDEEYEGGISKGHPRLRGETSEERRLRKAAVKAQRREQRKKKKETKIMFKEEESRLVKQTISNQLRNPARVHM